MSGVIFDVGEANRIRECVATMNDKLKNKKVEKK